MGSIGAPYPGEVKLPTIKLDTTLAELYKRACPERANTRLGWVCCGISSGVDLTPDFPRNSKFLYEDQAFVTGSKDELGNRNTRLQRPLAQKYLSHISQRDAFISGNTPVIFFNLSQTPEDVEHGRRDAEDTISVLDPSQRPELIFCSGPGNIPMKEHGIGQLEYKVTIDGLEGYPLTHDLETHFFLNSKAALARSGLPTPKAEIIKTKGCPPAADSCCRLCAEAAQDTSHLPSIPSQCTGPRGQWLTAQTARILAAVRARPVPFVFKTQQAFGGAGTWLITSPEKKTQLLADLAGTYPTNQEEGKEKEKENSGLLPRLLPLLTPQNAHLAPTTVLLTDLVPNPAGDYGLTFVVSSSGEAHFLAAAEQMFTSDGSSAWVGSTIDYRRQGELEERFGGLMRRVAAWVAGRGYVGVVGADVLVTDETGGIEDGDGEGGGLFVVDLNVRTSGSVPLPLLRGHFTERGLMCASTFAIVVRGGRRGFIARWRRWFEEGRMLILSWYEDMWTGESIGTVVVGGEDRRRLEELMRAVGESTDEVTL
jgi:hypothetical protein